MIELLKHAYRTNREEILAKSLLNCHAMGVHSLMLIDQPGQRVRLFYAHYGHNLDENHYKADFFTVALHPHHCELTLVPLFGDIWQITMHLEHSAWLQPRTLNQYRYDSAVTGGTGTFTETDASVPCFLGMHRLQQDEYMPAMRHHTMAVRSGNAAWMVLEGQDDGQYAPYCYNTRIPTTHPAMYGKMEDPSLKMIYDEIMQGCACR